MAQCLEYNFTAQCLDLKYIITVLNKTVKQIITLYIIKWFEDNKKYDYSLYI